VFNVYYVANKKKLPNHVEGIILLKKSAHRSIIVLIRIHERDAVNTQHVCKAQTRPKYKEDATPNPDTMLVCILFENPEKTKLAYPIQSVGGCGHQPLAVQAVIKAAERAVN
jgi:hypothetical protein